jgi:hypothetical protein
VKFATIPRRHVDQESGKQVGVRRAWLARRPRPGPAWRGGHTEQHFETLGVRLVYDVVNALPGKCASHSFDLIPSDLLLDPTEASARHKLYGFRWWLAAAVNSISSSACNVSITA